MLEDTIKARLEQLKNDRQQYVIEAERNLAAYNTVIAELEQLLHPEPQEQNDA